MRRRVSTGAFVAALVLGLAGLGVGAETARVNAQAKPEAMDVKIDNFSFGPAGADGDGGHHDNVDESRRHSPRS